MKQKSLFRHADGTRLFKSFVATTFISMSFAGAVAQAGEATYRYYKFSPTLTPDGSIQLSEFTFSRAGKKLNINNTTGVGTPVTVAVTGGGTAPESGEGASKLVDGLVTSKWFNGTYADVTFSFDAPVTIDSYNFATANDFAGRTPVVWTFSGSNDNTTWTPIETRTIAAENRPARWRGALYTYQEGYSLPNLAGVPVINNISAATPVIIASGDTAVVTYDIANATSVTLNPGNIDLTGTPGFTLTPTETTTYTLTATGTAGSISRSFDVRVAATKPQTFRYVRYTPLQLRTEGANSIQISEFEFYNGDALITGVTASNPGGRNSGDGSASQVVDGSATTKWLDFNKEGLVFDFGSSKAFTGYQFVTGNDATKRDPVRWMLEGSNDATVWTTLEVVASGDYPTPVTRRAASGILPFTYTPQTWTAAQNSDWDKVSANFSTPTIFADGRDVAFDDTASEKFVTIVEAVAPRTLSVGGDSGTYFFGGAQINGRAPIIKKGLGEAIFSTPNSLLGEVVVNRGKLSSVIQRGLGEPEATGRMLVRDAATLELSGDQFGQRTLSSLNGVISIPDASKFTHSGPIKISPKLTKTGGGTLTLYGLGGFTTPVDNSLVVEAGTVEFATGYFNNEMFGGNRLNAVVKTGATLRGLTGHSFAGDQSGFQNGIGQFRIEGTLEHASGIQYLPQGLITTNGVAQGRVVLKGGILGGGGQLEPARRKGDEVADLDATNNARSVISTEGSDLPSIITGAGSLTLNPGHLVFDVANGIIDEDLIVAKVMNGGVGIIKENAGNLLITRANTYAGTKNTYVERIDNPLKDPNYDQTLASVKAFDLPDGTTIRGGTVTVINTEGSATGPSPVRLMSGTTLAGTGFITGEVKAEGTLAPGLTAAPVGTLSVGPTALSGTYRADVNGATADKLVVTGNLAITGSLVIQPVEAGVTAPSYVIATYTGTRTGSFASTSGLPSGYSVVYDDSVTPHEVRIQQGGAVSGYDAFVANSGLTGTDALPKEDPDKDGFSNVIEFVIGGDPKVSSQAQAPTMTRNQAGDFVFTFRRKSEAAYLNPSVEYSTTLTGAWTAAPAGSVSVQPNGFGAGIDSVTVTLPAGLSLNGKFFARLKVVL